MIIVTGANGFLGKHLVAELERRDEHVYGWDLPDSPDIRNPVSFPFTKVDTIYHLAGLSNIVPSIANPRDYYETNVTGTFNMLEAARLSGVKKFVYAASSSCYGMDPASPIKEDHPCNPAQPYALTKYLGEQLVMHYGKVYGGHGTGMEVASLRIFNAYGPGCLTKTTCPSMLNIFLAQRANGKPLTIVGDGEQERDWVYVDDVVDAFICVAKNKEGKGIYNTGTGLPTSVKAIADIIGGPRVHIPKRGGEPNSLYCDNSKLQALGWKPKIGIEQGLEKMMENLDYWKGERVFTVDGIQEETRAWTARLKA